MKSVLFRYAKVIGAIVIAIFVVNTWVKTSDIKGKYILYNGEDCSFFPHSIDTLVIGENSLKGRNFPGFRSYQISTDCLSKSLDISYEGGRTGISLNVERPVFGKLRLRICMDVSSYYVKID